MNAESNVLPAVIKQMFTFNSSRFFIMAYFTLTVGLQWLVKKSGVLSRNFSSLAHDHFHGCLPHSPSNHSNE